MDYYYIVRFQSSSLASRVTLLTYSLDPWKPAWYTGCILCIVPFVLDPIPQCSTTSRHPLPCLRRRSLTSTTISMMMIRHPWPWTARQHHLTSPSLRRRPKYRSAYVCLWFWWVFYQPLSIHCEGWHQLAFPITCWAWAYPSTLAQCGLEGVLYIIWYYMHM